MNMKELYKKFFDNELLTEATKVELETAVTTMLSEAVAAAREEEATKVRAELTEEFVANKNALIEAIDTKTTEFLQSEMAELQESIVKYHDLEKDLMETKEALETEYAAKLVEARSQMAETVKNDMVQLVDRLDEFLDIYLDAEMAELKESIEEVKKINFGKTIFEAFETTFQQKYNSENATALALAEAQSQLKETSKVLEGVNKELDSVKRDQKLTSLLESLQGSPREIMAVILDKVPTDKLEENYNKFIGRVLHESVMSTSKVERTKSEKEHGNTSVLAEGKDSSATGDDKLSTKVVTGDTPILENDSDSKQEIETKRLDESQANRIRFLAGMEQ